MFRCGMVLPSPRLAVFLLLSHVAGTGGFFPGLPQTFPAFSLLHMLVVPLLGKVLCLLYLWDPAGLP